MTAKKRPKLLSHGRPPIINTKERERMSSKQSRNTIRTHHTLHKQRAAALKKGDKTLVENIDKAIEQNGGLKAYQAASKQGQSKTRGGDSSKVLVSWLREAGVINSSPSTVRERKRNAPLRLLEIGALSSENEISKFPRIIDVTRIDLNSQGSDIEKQDFMERPLPSSSNEAFDIISLSLVLNYVPDAAHRGEMLKRIARFLRESPERFLRESPERFLRESPESNATILPALFLVLPLPCVQNSRYLDERLLLEIMENLGFCLTHCRNTPKLCHYLLQMVGKSNRVKTGKKMIRDGPAMNNFCVVVE
ncbi:hypothetical protein CC78DRAFT_561930 [Lojkania enalia]|uniref:25S rRNA adenine-N(1) methyltransferase n=1 Tax=Lojkania enalia TaxID=147567 RepID=A0A9P4K2S4_9PLEO|nr:hypothetical protein CC78DRAFT_561930 [Didymosphaeria enalia]